MPRASACTATRTSGSDGLSADGVDGLSQSQAAPRRRSARSRGRVQGGKVPFQQGVGSERDEGLVAQGPEAVRGAAGEDEDGRPAHASPRRVTAT